MVVNKVGKDIPQSYAEQYGIYEGELAHIDAYQEASRAIKPVKPRETKLLGSIREAIEKTGLKDGMTISFHHHFREGLCDEFSFSRDCRHGAEKHFDCTGANVHEPDRTH